MITLFATSTVILAIKLYQSFNRQNIIQTKLVDPPTAYNNTININLWLKECEKYFAAADIVSDDEKREEMLKRLDNTSKEAIREAIKTKHLKRFEEIANETKRLFGTSRDVARN